MRDFHIRLEESTWEAVLAMAARRDEPVALLIRRLVKQGIAGDAAADGSAVVARTVRPVIRTELEALRKLLFRDAFDTAVSGQLIVWLIQEHLASHRRIDELKAVIADARQRGADRLRRNAESELLALWDDDNDLDNSHGL
ncbi:hypothetical protein [Sulfobacillus harzensis]|uniref:Uncharacterized protein n=1 Tax=Sulfobacillus harzensis TaxID=2729629 RepID=A0A7Y0L6T2_9FIRM|nr:hypothetical protein [Sulfobacillus harzensis]NMP23490.1 hypothetical protein [Sulfobacillus harzensis]